LRVTLLDGALIASYGFAGLFGFLFVGGTLGFWDVRHF
jgi:hypothetical protein